MTPSATPWPHLAPEPTGHLKPGPEPSFSVIIAAYQAAETVSGAVDSALEQTSPPREVIVADDASSDGTAEALAPYGDRIELIRRARNGGEGAAKNTAALAATGDFVAILDADDVYLPERLEALAELARVRPDLDILTTDAHLELDGRRLRRAYDPTWAFECNDQRSGILRRNFIFGHAAVRRAALLEAGGFDESIRRTTDWDMWLRMIFAGSRAGLVDAPLSSYRLHEHALSSDRVAMTLGRIETLRKAASADLGLTPSEARVLERSIENFRRLARLGEAREALLGRTPEARELAIAIASDAGFTRGTRFKAAISVAAPGLARRIFSSRQGGGWTGVGGIRGESSERP